MTEREIYQALRSRYGKEAVLVSQVPNATGAGRSRTVDAIAIGCWPSRGLYIHAIEIKSSRSDLIRELAQPAKADAIARYCDEFWIATPAGWDGLQVPEQWGLYEVSGLAEVTVRQKAQKIEAEPLNRSFVAAIARALVAQHATEQQISEAEERGRREVRQQRAEDAAQLHRELRTANTELTRYQCMLRGVDASVIDRWRRIVDNLTGRVGSLNALRVNAREVLEHADEIERLGNLLFKEEP